MDTSIQQFLEITSVDDPQIASNYLEMAAGDLENAIELWTQMSTFTAAPTPSENDDAVRTPDEIYSQSLYPGSHIPNASEYKPKSYRSPFEVDSKADKSNKLAQMYLPPNDINVPGNFFDVQNLAMERQLWLLVNIQDPKEFKCHQLNRDIWSNSIIREIIKENFLFWQREIEGDESSNTFINLYKVTEIPFVAIIHPRTGKLMKSFKQSTFLNTTFMTTQLFEFLDQYPNVTQNNIQPTPEHIKWKPKSSSYPVSHNDSTSFTSTNEKSEPQPMPNTPEQSDSSIELNTTESSVSSYHGVNSELAELRKQRESRRKS